MPPEPTAGMPIADGSTRGTGLIDAWVDDIRDVAMENASLVLLNFTLQFVAPQDRDAVIRKIVEGLVPGGALMISEKVTGEDASSNLLDRLHADFKRAQGYSELEISQKRTSIENTLRTDPVPVHLDRLHRCGFRVATPWFSCLGFVSILAIK